MKVFIIFLSLILVFTMFMVYTIDMNNYMDLQRQMKAIAEECAGGGALLWTDESFEEQRVIIDSAKAQEYMDHLVQTTVISCPPLGTGTLTASAELLADDTLKATVTYTCAPGKNLFHGFLHGRTTVSRSSTYKWEGPEDEPEDLQ